MWEVMLCSPHLLFSAQFSNVFWTSISLNPGGVKQTHHLSLGGGSQQEGGQERYLSISWTSSGRWEYLRGEVTVSCPYSHFWGQQGFWDDAPNAALSIPGFLRP